MAMNNQARPSVFAQVLNTCRNEAAFSYDDLAIELINHGFPSSRYSGQMSNLAADQAWLANMLETLERATTADSWPFGYDLTEFIDPAAAAMQNVFLVHWRLTAALALDVLDKDSSFPWNQTGPGGLSGPTGP